MRLGWLVSRAPFRMAAFTLRLSPAKPVYLVEVILSDLDAPNHRASAQMRAGEMTVSEINRVLGLHREWWQELLVTIVCSNWRSGS